jgi:voltage-gated potassium channel
MASDDNTSVERSLFGQLREGFHRLLAPRRHSVLLAAIIAAFLVRPFVGDSGAGPPLFSLLMMILLLMALYNIDVTELVGDHEILLAQRRRRNFITWTLAAAAIVERWISIFVPEHSFHMGGSALWLLLFAYITWSELRAVLKQREVTREVISMSISTYLLLGLTCGMLYIVLYDLHPTSFVFSAGAPNSPQQAIPILIYFSLTTLSTIGFGDITPVTLQARYIAVAEGITGQFYLAILVARLVSMQMIQPASSQPAITSADSEKIE